MQEKKIFIAGAGHAGRAFVESILDSRLPGHTVIGLADSSGAICAEAGLNSPDLSALLEHKRHGKRLSSFVTRGSLHFTAYVPDAIKEMRPTFVAEMSPTDTETGGGAKANAQAAIAAGSHLVFASKGVLVSNWDMLFATAKTARTRIRYSATVGAGIPILDAGSAFSLANPVFEIETVLNGTCVYILSLMETGMELDEALKHAQIAGLAEADPSSDIDGLDAAAKLCILARTVMKRSLRMADIARESLRSVKTLDILHAKARNMHIRAVGKISLADETLTASVTLREIPSGSPLARRGTENAVIFHSRHAGELTLMGKGAGPSETASAVTRDILVLGNDPAFP